MRSHRQPSSESALEEWQVEALIFGLIAWVVYFVLCIVRRKGLADAWTTMLAFVLVSGVWLFVVNISGVVVAMLGSITKSFGLSTTGLISLVTSAPFYFGSLILVNCFLITYFLRENTDAINEPQEKSKSMTIESDGSVCERIETNDEAYRNYPRMYVSYNPDTMGPKSPEGSHITTGVPKYEVEDFCMRVQSQFPPLKTAWIGSHAEFRLQFPEGHDFLDGDTVPNQCTEWSTDRQEKDFIFCDAIKVFEGDSQRSAEMKTTPTREAIARLVRSRLRTSTQQVYDDWYRKYFPAKVKDRMNDQSQ